MKIEHVGIAVKDLMDSMSKLACIDRWGFDVETLSYTNNGKPVAKLKIAKLDGIELIQVMEGEIPEPKLGLHHIGILVKNLEDELKKLKHNPYVSIMRMERSGVKLAYVKVRDLCIMELVQRD